LATFLPTQELSHPLIPTPFGERVVALLNRRLSDAIDLEARCREAEWNLPASTPQVLRELFSTLRHDAATFVDALAARIVEIGGAAEGTPRVVAQRSGLLEVLPPSSAVDPELGPLSGALTAFASRIRIAVYEASRLGDAESAAVCAWISRATENDLRRLKSPLAGAA
jgi:DNA-binding ferritin-like protein